MNSMNLDEKDVNMANLRNEANAQINFLKKLSYMTNRVQVYNEHFGHKRPIFEKLFLDRKQRQLRL